MQVIFFSLQGDFGQSHKYCPSDDHPLVFYSFGRTVLVHFKSDAFIAGNGLNITFKIAGKFHFLSEPEGCSFAVTVLSPFTGKTATVMYSFS